MPAELLKAVVVSLYKKGDPKLQGNYRPISLLNALYKLYAGLLKGRLEEHMEAELPKTQFGFRKARSTSQAIYCIRRCADWAERGGTGNVCVSGLGEGL